MKFSKKRISFFWNTSRPNTESHLLNYCSMKFLCKFTNTSGFATSPIWLSVKIFLLQLAQLFFHKYFFIICDRFLDWMVMLFHLFENITKSSRFHHFNTSFLPKNLVKTSDQNSSFLQSTVTLKRKLYTFKTINPHIWFSSSCVAETRSVFWFFRILVSFFPISGEHHGFFWGLVMFCGIKVMKRFAEK